MHIFPFSVRKYTAISRDKNLVDSNTIKKRFIAVNELNKQIKNEYLNKFINKTVDVIFENPKDKKIQEGHSNYFFKVYAKTCKNLHSQLLKVKIIKVVNDKAFCELI